MAADLPHYSADSYLSLANTTAGNSPNSRDKQNNYSVRRKSKKRASQSYDCNDYEDVPWRKTEAYSTGVVGLHQEINDFYEVMKPTAEETELRLKVVEHITKVVYSQWPLAKVEIFGSFRTGMYLPSSDIDVVVIGNWKSAPLSTLSKALEDSGINSKDIEIIANAKVPIIRMVHSPSTIKLDISFNVLNGVKGAKLIKKMIKEHPVLPKLVLVLKQFLIQRGLNEVYNGGMSSYCLTLLVASLLQGYHKPQCQPSTNLGTLLLEFFEHYGINFNYERVSIHFKEGSYYRPRFTSRVGLSVEDPLQEGNNIAHGTFLMHLLKMSFQNAYFTLSKAVLEHSNCPPGSFPVHPGSYLGLILKVDKDVLRKRDLMKHNYSKIMRELSHLL